jgi:predicted DNA-binding protein
MKRTNIHLAPDQIERLREAAERKGVSVAELVRRAIEAYLDAEERRRKKR